MKPSYMWLLLFHITVSGAVNANCTEAISSCHADCCNAPGCSCSVYTNKNGLGFGPFGAVTWCEYSYCVLQTGEDCANNIGHTLFGHNTTSDQFAVANGEWEACLAWGCDLKSYEHTLLCISQLDSCLLGDTCSPQCKADTHSCRLRFNCAEDTRERCLVDAEYTGCPNTEEICDFIYNAKTPEDAGSEAMPIWLLIVIAVAGTIFAAVTMVLCVAVRSWKKQKLNESRRTKKKTGAEVHHVVEQEANPLKAGFRTTSVAHVSIHMNNNQDDQRNSPVANTSIISSIPADNSITKVVSTVESVKSEDPGSPRTEAGPSGSCIPTPEALLNVKSDRTTFDKWQRSHLIGKGSYGEVFLGILHTGLFVAVKVVDLTKGLSEKAVADLLGEVSLMKGFEHPNITQYLDVEYDRHLFRLNIFMEFVDGGALSTLVKRLPTFLDESVCRRYTIQILKGLAYLHDMSVIHRDIKGENVLIRTDGIVKLADFGCSKKIADAYNKNKGCSTLVGTPYWMAPEVIGGSASYGSASDIWSVGCTVSEMLNKGAPPWPTYPTMWAAIYHIASANSLPTNLPGHVSEHATSFMHACMVLKPEERPAARELLDHPFLIGMTNPVAPPPQPGRLFDDLE